jgi:hypothetical protein
MKLNKLTTIVICAAIVATQATSIPVYADFEQTENGYVYSLDDGTYATGWKTINKHKYYFDKNGIMKTGWLKFKSGKKYYFRSNGQMATGKLKINGTVYNFGKDGVLVSNSSSPKSETNQQQTSNIDTTALTKELNSLIAKNEQYEDKIFELENERDDQKYYMDYYYEIYLDSKDSYNNAVNEAKMSSNTRLVYSGNGNYTLKSEDYNNDYYVKEWKKVLDQADREYRKWKNAYDKTSGKISAYKTKIEDNKERISEITTLLNNN